MSSEIMCCSYCGKIDYGGQKTECPFCHKSAMLKTGYTQDLNTTMTSFPALFYASLQAPPFAFSIIIYHIMIASVNRS